MTISTPEGVEIHLSLAGLGSRFVAALIDTLIRTIVAFAVAAVTVGLDFAFGSQIAPDELALGAAIAFVVIFAINFFYDVLFEVLASGRTPGKRLTGLRVVREGGQPVGAKASMIRNLLRLVDWLPVSYLAGIVAIVATKRNQRIGDIAAGTLVVREVRDQAVVRQPAPSGPAQAVPAWDVSTITVEEITAVKSFLERRSGIEREARKRVAWELAARLRPKVGGAPADDHPEDFLEQLARAKVI